jgi:hypothetical protein
MTRPSIQITPWLLCLALGLGGPGCLPGDDDDDDVADDDAADDDVADDDVADDDDTAPDPFRVSGEVFVVPVYYQLDEDDIWVRHELEWTDIDPAGYPYGLLYVGVTSSFEDTAGTFLHHVPSSMPVDPKSEGSPYQFAPLEWAVDEAFVLAIADTYHDGVISAWDCMAYYKGALDTAGEQVEEADIIVDMEFVSHLGQWVPGCHMCSGGGWVGDPVDISGNVYLDQPAHPEGSGDALVAVYRGSNGPYWSTVPGRLDGGAQLVPQEWAMTVYNDFDAAIYGAWDWNDNGLFEPGDEWGTVLTEVDGETINPMTIGDDPIEGILVEIPVAGAGPGVMPRPYLRVSGEITHDHTFSFADLGPNAVMYVLGGKHYLPNLGEEEIYILLGEEKVWSYHTIHNPDQYLEPPTIPYQLWIPAYQTSVMYVVIDLDGDDIAELEYRIDENNGAVPVDVTYADVELDLTVTLVP